MDRYLMMFGKTSHELRGLTRICAGLRAIHRLHSSARLLHQKKVTSLDSGAENTNWREIRMKAKAKLVGGMWRPSKRLSPDATDGIRALNAQHPDLYTPQRLAKEFDIPFEAIRRILKSTFQPTEEQAERRRIQWDKRGQKIWSNLVREGLKPPKKWREMGIRRRPPGVAPLPSHSMSSEHVNKGHTFGESTTARLSEEQIDGNGAFESRVRNKRKGGLSDKLL